MTSRTTRLVWIVLWFATALAAGLVVGWTEHRPQSVGLDEPADTSRVHREPLDGEAAMPALRTHPEPAIAAAPNVDSAPVGSSPAGPAPSLFAQRGWIRVEVDGPATKATAYALPQGAQGVNSENDVAVALVHRNQRLPVPLPGLYDIGVQFGSGPVLLRDVEVRAGETTTVRVKPPVPGNVTCSLAGEALPPHVEVTLSLKPNYDNVTLFPGRGDRPALAGVNARISANTDVNVSHGATYAARAWLVVSMSVPRDKRVALRPTGEHSVVLSKSRIQAGDHVTATIKRQRGLHVRIAGRSKSSPLLVLHLERESKPIARTVVGAGIVPQRVTLWASPGRATLVWRGRDWQRGTKSVELKTAQDTTVDIAPTQITPEPISTVASSALTRFETVVAAPISKDALLQVAFESENDDGHRYMQRHESAGATYEIEAESLEARWVWLTRGTYLADRIRVAPGRTRRVTLQPGGYLAVVYAGPMPANFEANGLALRRKDGGLFWYRDSANDAHPKPATRVPFRSGMVLGPLATGSQTFELLGGAVSNGVVTAEVTSGGIEPLVVR